MFLLLSVMKLTVILSTYIVYKIQALNSMHGKVIYGTRISVTYSHNYPNISSNNVADNALTSGNSSLGGTGGSSTANPVTTTNTSNDGDNATKNLLQLKDLVSTLANKGHPVNINDISNFNGGNSVNRNSRWVG